MQTISAMRELHGALLTLVEEGRTYAFPSSDPLDPILKATVYCTAEERTQAIPLSALREMFAESERAFLAALN